MQYSKYFRQCNFKRLELFWWGDRLDRKTKKVTFILPFVGQQTFQASCDTLIPNFWNKGSFWKCFSTSLDVAFIPLLAVDVVDRLWWLHSVHAPESTCSLCSIQRLKWGLDCAHLLEGWAERHRPLWGLMGSWNPDTIYCCDCDHTQPSATTLSPLGRWRGTAFLCATMATSLQRWKSFCGPQWLLSARCCRCWGPLWVCAASVPSSGFSCQRYDGALFRDGHRAECGNGRHLSRRTLTSSALSSQGRRLRRQGQTITRCYSLSCNEAEIERRNWAMTADTILWFKGETQERNGHSNSITLGFIVFL